MQIDETDRFSGVFVTRAEKCMAMMTTTIHKLETSWVLSWLYHFLNLWWISLSPIRTIQEHCYGDKWFVSNSQCKHSTLVTWCDDTLLFLSCSPFPSKWILNSHFVCDKATSESCGSSHFPPFSLAFGPSSHNSISSRLGAWDSLLTTSQFDL